MQTDLTDYDVSPEGLMLSFSMRLPSGKLVEIYKRPSYELVNTSDLCETRHTMSRIVGACMRAGVPCSAPQALAAAYSVPDGAPIGMALLNVGPLPSDDVCARHEAFLAQERANVRAFRRGPRY